MYFWYIGNYNMEMWQAKFCFHRKTNQNIFYEESNWFIYESQLSLSFVCMTESLKL